MANAKSDQVTTINPLYHRIDCEGSSWKRLRTSCLIPLAVLKILLMLVIGIVAQILVCVGGYELTEETLTTPLPKWKRVLRWIIANIVMRVFVAVSGFKWKIKETGKRASPEEAPILVVAPHSSYFDVFVVILLGAPSVVAKSSTNNFVLFGRLAKMTQGLFVSRKDKESKREATEMILKRAKGILNGSGMPQLYIYPEGTTGNRSSLLKFKAGAFIPGVPVQPVLIRYPNAIDAVTYTFDGPSLYQSIWNGISLQFFVNIEIEYLPVYVPSEEERKDPDLFCENVRRVMSESLDIPMSEYTYEDGNLLVKLRAKVMNKLRRIRRAKQMACCDGLYRKEYTMLLESVELRKDFNWTRNIQEFLNEFFYLEPELADNVPGMSFVFDCFKGDDSDSSVDIRPYVVLASLSSDNKALSTQMIVDRIYNMYCITEENNTDNMKEISEVIKRIFELEEENLQVNPGVNNQDVGAGDADAANLEKDAVALRRKLAVCVEFTKLFANEVHKRLPKNYPPRADRDKPIREIEDKLD